MQKRNKISTKHLVLDAVLIALYVVLGFWKIPIGNILRINMASFSVIIASVCFGPVHGLLVGFLGEFLSQILGPYGLTPTTLLWALPEAARGLLLGFAVWMLTKKKFDPTKLTGKFTTLYLLFCVITGIIASLLNTLALYVDSKMFGYYNDYMVFGILLVRLGIAIVLSGTLGYMAQVIASALRRNKFI